MRYLLIDGHSVIFAWPELRKLHAKRTGLAREALIKQLTAYQDASEVRVVAVFDGKGEKFSEDSIPGSIQVFYSASGQSADSIIERLVAKYAGAHEMTVVTNDHLEQQTVTTFGAVAVSAELFRKMLDEAADGLSHRLKQLKRK